MLQDTDRTIQVSTPGVLANAQLPVPPHILAIDDDRTNRELIAEYLRQNDLRITAVPNGPAMHSVLEEEAVDLVLLNPKLKTEDGMTLVQRLRDLSAIPVIILTDRAEEADKVMGLELGADDYLTKPFSTRELLARIRALLRRSRAQQTAADGLQKVRAYRFAGSELSVRLRRLTTPTRGTVALSNTEFNLLAAFLAAPQRVLSRDQLLSLSRLHNDEVYDRAVDTQVSRLRRKIEPAEAEVRLIRTERGAGYIFTAAVEIVR